MEQIQRQQGPLRQNIEAMGCVPPSLGMMKIQLHFFFAEVNFVRLVSVSVKGGGVWIVLLGLGGSPRKLEPFRSCAGDTAEVKGWMKRAGQLLTRWQQKRNNAQPQGMMISS